MSATSAYTRKRLAEVRESCADLAADLVEIANQADNGRVMHPAIMACQLRDLAEAVTRELETAPRLVQ